MSETSFAPFRHPLRGETCAHAQRGDHFETGAILNTKRGGVIPSPFISCVVIVALQV